MRKQYRSFPFEVREVNLEEGIFEGHASVFGNMDSYETIFDKGCFRKTLKENFDRVKCMLDHEHLIGKPVWAKEDEMGLLVRGKITRGVQKGEEALLFMADKVLTDLSFAFDTLKDSWEKGVRHIKEVRLWEFGPVIWGSNDRAAITLVRKLKNVLETRDFDADFDAAQLRQTPWLLINTLNSSLDNALYGSLQPDEKYQTLHTMLSQFDERFAQWIEDAYAAMSQRAFVFERETLSLPASTEPATATPEEQRADEVPDEMVSALAEMCKSMAKIITEV